MLEKTFDPKEIEKKFLQKWFNKVNFRADVNSPKRAFSLMMPPPNVTGSLHMGHAFNHSIQDFIIRFERMRGKDTLWQPGTDHASIATQMVVERLLDKEGTNRHKLGREKFLERVWEWKEQSGNTIVTQLHQLGASADWSRERFTMDAGLNDAVTKVFVELYKEGLIYKDKRLVNWDPKLHTAISDLEVEQKENDGFLWHFKYPLATDSSRHIVIATTRPETMLGDVAVAVHPDDERYKDLIGQKVKLPITGREVPIIADEWADPETGSGAVKITPAHDFNDFDVAKRHGLDMINIFDKNAHLNENVPKAYQGLDRFVARTKIIEELQALSLVEQIVPHKNTVPYGDRSGVVIEPWLTDQWYCDAKTMAIPAIEAVKTGKTKFYPQQWEKTYFEWMNNIQPWCISRQLWWGHQIPAWYGPDAHVFVALDETDAMTQAKAHYGKSVTLTRDEDVLDTWFSSALWPFSTLGWPEKTPELDRYFPTDVLVTGFDIIFFWVARMMMMTLHFMKDVPFKHVYIHALVRDEHGQKMSKSKGNVIDPLEITDQYGTDALRFTLASMAAQGRDIKLAINRIEGYRNFSTKIWNAARFCDMNGAKLNPNFKPETAQHPLNKWILSRLYHLQNEVTEGLENYYFNISANGLYQFIWGEFCDWYVEFIKTIFQDDTISEAMKEETRSVMGFVLKNMLLLLHPFMPYVTEEIAEQLNLNDGKLLCLSDWPTLSSTLENNQSEADLAWVIKVISAIRNIRAEVSLPYSTRIDLYIKGASGLNQERAKNYEAFLMKAGYLNRLSVIPETDTAITGLQDVIDEATLIIPVNDLIDLSKEKERLEKEITRLNDEISLIEKKLSNKSFVDKAPQHVVDEQNTKKIGYISSKEKVAAALQKLASL